MDNKTIKKLMGGAKYINWVQSGKGISKQTKYGLLSSLAYSKTNKERAEMLKKFDKDGNWELLPEYSGRHASVYKSTRTNEIVISVRGTDLKSKDTRYKDLRTDIGIAAGVSKFGKRNAQITKLVRKVRRDFPDTKPVLTGHSLGARIASDVAKKEEIPAVVYNKGSSPMDIIGYLKDKLFGAKKHDITHFNTNKGLVVDPVSISSAVLSGDENEIVKQKKGNNPHSLTNFIDKDNNQIGIGKKPKKKRPLSKWNIHVKNVKAKNPSKSFKEILKIASGTYVK